MQKTSNGNKKSMLGERAVAETTVVIPPVDPPVDPDTTEYQIVTGGNTITQTNVNCTNLAATAITGTNYTFSGIVKSVGETLKLNGSTGNIICNGIQPTTILNDDFLYMKDNALYEITASATQVESDVSPTVTVSGGTHTKNLSFTIPRGIQGIAGVAGTNGTNGTSAVQPTFVVEDVYETLDGEDPSVEIHTYDGGLTYNLTFYLKTGERGPRGPGGSDGSDGSKGDKGDKGDKGEAGSNGDSTAASAFAGVSAASAATATAAAVAAAASAASSSASAAASASAATSAAASADEIALKTRYMSASEALGPSTEFASMLSVTGTGDAFMSKVFKVTQNGDVDCTSLEATDGIVSQTMTADTVTANETVECPTVNSTTVNCTTVNSSTVVAATIDGPTPETPDIYGDGRNIIETSSNIHLLAGASVRTDEIKTTTNLALPASTAHSLAVTNALTVAGATTLSGTVLAEGDTVQLFPATRVTITAPTINIGSDPTANPFDTVASTTNINGTTNLLSGVNVTGATNIAGATNIVGTTSVIGSINCSGVVNCAFLYAGNVGINPSWTWGLNQFA